MRGGRGGGHTNQHSYKEKSMLFKLTCLQDMVSVLAQLYKRVNESFNENLPGVIIFDGICRFNQFIEYNLKIIKGMVKIYLETNPYI